MSTLGINIFTEVIPALVIVFGAPVAIWWYMRRSRKGSVGRLQITDKAVLGKSVWVAVVEVDDKRFLVGAGESGVGLISELEALPMAVHERADQPADRMAGEPVVQENATSTTNGITEQPRMGLVRRLQLMTVRSPAQNPWRSFGGSGS